jgi:transposase
MEPIWEQCSVLLPERPAMSPTHPLGCHRRRIPDRVVFDAVGAALVYGSGYARIATSERTDRTIRRRLHEWTETGLLQELHALVLVQDDRMIGLELADVAVDGCITKAPGGGEVAGRSPVDRGKQGRKRSVLTDATGVPLQVIAAGANRYDSPLLESTLAGLDAWGIDPAVTTVHLDRGDDRGVTRALLDELGFTGEIAHKGLPAPVQVGQRWVVERTHAWMNGFGKLRRGTEKARQVVEGYLSLAATVVVVRCLIQRARTRYRWPGRPTTRRLK